MVMGVTLSPESILLQIDELTLYCHYIGEIIDVGETTNSPFRNDTVPSFCLYEARNRIMWRDHGSGNGGDVFELIGLIYDLSFREVLLLINEDFDLNLTKTKLTKEVSRREVDHSFRGKFREKIKIAITEREFLTEELSYWRGYGITKKTLERYNVKVPRYLHFISKTKHDVITPNELCFAYQMRGGYKIYFPESNTQRFYSNYPSHLIEGFDQLVKNKKKDLIITKSMKDVMCLHELGFSAVSPRSESTVMPQEYFNYFNNHFNNKFVLFDNDMKHNGDKYPYPKIYMPETLGKDISDVIKKTSKKKTLEILKECIELEKKNSLQ